MLSGESVSYADFVSGSDVEQGTKIHASRAKSYNISIADETASIKPAGQHPPTWDSFSRRVFHVTLHDTDTAAEKYADRIIALMGKKNNGLRIVSAAGQLRIPRADVLLSLKPRTSTPADQIPAGLWTSLLPYTRMWACAVGAAPAKTRKHERKLQKGMCGLCKLRAEHLQTLGHL